MLSLCVYSHLLVKSLLKMAKGTPVGEDWVAKQLEKYALNFDEADADKNGSLRFREIVFALVKGGFRGTYNEAKFEADDISDTVQIKEENGIAVGDWLKFDETIFTELDKNADRAVSRQEYLLLMKGLDKAELKSMAMRREFKLIDADGSGFLTRVEITDAITKAELNPNAENMSNLLIGLIHDKDQKLSYEEFLKAWSGHWQK